MVVEEAAAVAAAARSATQMESVARVVTMAAVVTATPLTTTLSQQDALGSRPAVHRQHEIIYMSTRSSWPGGGFSMKQAFFWRKSEMGSQDKIRAITADRRAHV